MSRGVPVPDPLCRLDEIADGKARGFDPLAQGRDTMFVVRQGETLFGWRNFCPHYGHEQMAWQKDGYLTHDGARIVCGAHGAEYEIDTGICVAGPCVGRRLIAVPLELRGGAIHISGGFSRRP
ncbi:MAG: Rieske 2Fe-2S domain-containing protein [Maritimibacter sp.]|nr:Rieske 2Fe-2S domain-containing protein [Maritimibacter sp.]